MVDQKPEMGFTVTELVVTLVVLSIFLTLFFQLFLTSRSQHVIVAQRAAANDIALTNLNKISTKTIVTGLAPCNNSNNLLIPPYDQYSVFAKDDGYGHNNWGSDGRPDREITDDTVLPNTGVVQEIRVQYPQGCAADAPAKITSIVQYGSEEVTHATFVK